MIQKKRFFDLKNITIFFFWIISILLLLQYHTPWRDEFQSYLVSSRTDSWFSFFEGVRYERHPPLHYLLLKGLHSLNLNINPHIEILIVTLPFTIGIGFLISFMFNLPLLIIFGILFSPYLLREHGIISRCYPIGGFFILLAAYFKRNNNQIAYVLSASLASGVSLIFTLASGAWFIADFLKNKIARKWIFLGLLISGLNLLYQFPPKDSIFPTSLGFRFGALLDSMFFFSQTLIGAEFRYPFSWNHYDSKSLAAQALFISYGIYLLRKAYKEKFLLEVMLMIFPSLYIMTSGYSASSRYLGSFFWIIMAILVSQNKILNFKRELFTFSLCALISSILWMISWNPFNNSPRFNFSDSANLLKEFPITKEDLILTEQDTVLFPIMALSDISIFHISRNKWLDYPYFRKSEIKFTPDSWCTQYFSDFLESNKNKRILWISQIYFRIPDSCFLKAQFELKYETKVRTVLDEEYKVYLIFPKG